MNKNLMIYKHFFQMARQNECYVLSTEQVSSSVGYLTERFQWEWLDDAIWNWSHWF